MKTLPRIPRIGRPLYKGSGFGGNVSSLVAPHNRSIDFGVEGLREPELESSGRFKAAQQVRGQAALKRRCSGLLPPSAPSTLSNIYSESKAPKMASSLTAMPGMQRIYAEGPGGGCSYGEGPGGGCLPSFPKMRARPSVELVVNSVRDLLNVDDMKLVDRTNAVVREAIDTPTMEFPVENAAYTLIKNDNSPIDNVYVLRTRSGRGRWKLHIYSIHDISTESPEFMTMTS